MDAESGQHTTRSNAQANHNKSTDKRLLLSLGFSPVCSSCSAARTCHTRRRRHTTRRHAKPRV